MRTIAAPSPASRARSSWKRARSRREWGTTTPRITRTGYASTARRCRCWRRARARPRARRRRSGRGNRAARRLVGVGGDAAGQPLDLHRRHQHLERPGGVAQPGGHVDRRTDVVVALEQQRVAGGHADAQRQRCADLGGAVLQVEGERHGVDLLDRHDHAPVTEPLGDAHASLAGDLADRATGTR